ncbi:MAG: rhodanese-like domain-containing protein [Clostridia bacterium]|nr:rhodanese-like domain-containing protein [Clostridia bacterium]
MKRMLPMFLLLSLTLTGCAASAPVSEANTYRQITMSEAVKLMEEEENYIILDVRTEQEYAAGHIPGAMVIPNETIGTEEISQLPDRDQLIMVYCRSGNRSRQASDKLVKLGYTNIVEFGGIIDWPGEIVTD